MSEKLLLQSLNQLKQWYEIHQPVVVDGFNEGISEEEVRQVEQELDVTFPDSLRTLLTIHNGTDAFVLFDGQEICRLLSANEIKAEYKTQQMSIEAQAELAQELNLPFHPQRLPVLLYLSGDFSYVHPDDGKLVYVPQEGDGATTYQDLAVFISEMATRLEKGRYQLDEYGNIRKTEIDTLWKGIRKFISGYLAHRGELFRAKISHQEQKTLLQTIRKIHPNFGEIVYNDLPESLRLTLSAQNGQTSDFRLFFYQEQSYYLLNSDEMIKELNHQKGNGRLLLPILSNDTDTVFMDLLSEELFINKTQSMQIDWTDFLLGYWANLQNHNFRVGDEGLFLKS